MLGWNLRGKFQSTSRHALRDSSPVTRYAVTRYIMETDHGTNCRANEGHARTTPCSGLAGIALGRTRCSLGRSRTYTMDAGSAERMLKEWAEELKRELEAARAQ
jgi:hypothetical protein